MTQNPRYYTGILAVNLIGVLLIFASIVFPQYGRLLVPEGASIVFLTATVYCMLED